MKCKTVENIYVRKYLIGLASHFFTLCVLNEKRYIFLNAVNNAKLLSFLLELLIYVSNLSNLDFLTIIVIIYFKNCITPSSLSLSLSQTHTHTYRRD